MFETSEICESYIREVGRLRKREFRSRTGRVIVEGYPEVSRAVKAGVKNVKLFICPELFVPRGNEFEGLNTICVSKDVFARMAFGDRLKGVLGIFEPQRRTLTQTGPFIHDPLIVILEGVEKPGNLGAVVRTCDGAGVDALLVCDAKTDIWNHHVVRSSIGTVFSVPTVSSSKDEIADFLKRHRIDVYVATARGEEVFTAADLKGRTALVVGNEHTGVSSYWRERAVQQIRIPMVGDGRCLNVAVSASILIYEARRQQENWLTKQPF